MAGGAERAAVTGTYIRVVLVEAVIILLLWALGHAFH
jgi:hypothetical protein